MIDLDNLARLVGEWRGVFDFSTDDDDVDILTFTPRECAGDHCDHLGPCASNVAEIDMAHESIAAMLNALPALLADHARLTAEVARLRGHLHPTLGLPSLPDASVESKVKA